MQLQGSTCARHRGVFGREAGSAPARSAIVLDSTKGDLPERCGVCAFQSGGGRALRTTDVVLRRGTVGTPWYNRAAVCLAAACFGSRNPHTVSTPSAAAAALQEMWTVEPTHEVGAGVWVPHVRIDDSCAAHSSTTTTHRLRKNAAPFFLLIRGLKKPFSSTPRSAGCLVAAFLLRCPRHGVDALARFSSPSSGEPPSCASPCSKSLALDRRCRRIYGWLLSYIAIHSVSLIVWKPCAGHDRWVSRQAARSASKV
ncbi:hypothetical protein B0J12DRAFT_258284 [Macrophomina phaseolina]|uniref:Uncharacterized protein n=1 Tax=Macrophomina phaseolina TaxID=35725 RepID=A0ABQ8G2G1_9PEZI|nr:hypothetical protein B0J12DRAFT_258284 [Macrophomina phaseolina]